jgi:hypothetical protein
VPVGVATRPTAAHPTPTGCWPNAAGGHLAAAAAPSWSMVSDELLLTVSKIRFASSAGR